LPLHFCNFANRETNSLTGSHEQEVRKGTCAGVLLLLGARPRGQSCSPVSSPPRPGAACPRARQLEAASRAPGGRRCLSACSTGIFNGTTQTVAQSQICARFASPRMLRGRCGVRPALAWARLAGEQPLRLPRYYVGAARCSLFRAALMARLGFHERAQLVGVVVAGH
jgi:hypothetical protein